MHDMFAAIAPRYDLLNHTLSLNIDRRWRRQAVDRLAWEATPEGVYLDLCAGTFDLATELQSRRAFRGSVVGADFVTAMLQIGKQKAPEILPVGADALSLPFPGACFDGCTVGFGIRNLEQIEAGLAEIARVLKPGKRLVILEFSTPKTWPIKPLYSFYFNHVLPLIGRLVSKHMTAYSYLPNSVEQFPQNGSFIGLLEAGGFAGVHQQRLTGGIASLYWGVAHGHR